MSRPLRSLIPLSLVAAALVAACGDRASGRQALLPSESSLASPAPAADMVAAPEAIAARGISSEKVSAEGGAQATLDQATAAQGGAASATSMIIRTGTASVQVDSLELAIAAVQRIATALGGWVGNTSLSAGTYEVRSATIELKVPSARYDEALAGLRPIGKVETVNSTAEDVGEEFVDLSARTANARRLEERLVTLLATRAGKLEDVLNVERELARVREEIERYEGRLRYLKTRVATSTLTVTVHERAPLVSPTPGENILGEAFKDAWRNFVRFVAAFIASLGTVIPVAVLLAIGALAWRRFRPRRLAPALRASETQS
ncbi:MAG: DUF4349 domain-containing protein [Gemmatimonadetes bacterium]|nr:DUF4349 domain-containing protein [Gemmatimonadota bacterium]MBK7833544.1 DUF4349 domain-containing protein [Gemmatimonadota bacterium]